MGSTSPCTAKSSSNTQSSSPTGPGRPQGRPFFSRGRSRHTVIYAAFIADAANPHGASMSFTRRSGVIDRPPADAGWARRLERWAELPCRQTNTGAIAFTGLMMICVLGGTWDMPGRAAFLRGVALAFIVLHGGMHVLILRLLKPLRARGVAAAARALAAYRDPRRVTNLDLAIGWAGFGALISLLNWLSASG